MLENIRSKNIIKMIIFNHLQKKTYYLFAKYNRNLKDKLDLKLDDYKELHKRFFYTIEIELIPITQLEPDKNYYFIRRLENKAYYHIYFNNVFNETNRNYITNKDKIEKINIKLDMELRSIKKLFYECTVLKEIKFMKFNRDDFTDLSEMFYGCINLSKLDIKKFKTPNVIQMNWMFSLCESLTELDITNLETSKVTYMNNLFSGCLRLKKINFNFNTSNVVSMKSMFLRCLLLKYVDISNFVLTNVKDFSEMFYECTSLEDINLTNLELSKQKYFNRMFGECNKILQTKIKNTYRGIEEYFVFSKKD